MSQEEIFSNNSLKNNEPAPSPHNTTRKGSRTGMFPSQSLKTKAQPHVTAVKKIKPAHTITLGSFSQGVPLCWSVCTGSDTSYCSWLNYTGTWQLPANGSKMPSPHLPAWERQEAQIR